MKTFSIMEEVEYTNILGYKLQGLVIEIDNGTLLISTDGSDENLCAVQANRCKKVVK